MLRRRGRDSHLAWVYGAARSAGSDAGAATAAAAAVASGGGRDAQMLAAVRAAIASSPCEPLASLPLEQREPIALARILGMDVDQIAATLGLAREEVKARMRAGLAGLARAPVAA
jgi:DNA-directed RNA polymerase specialized sigma24 family protein